MSERSDIHAEFIRSPRVIVIEADSEELTMQDLVDTLKGIIEKSWNGIDEPYLHLSDGKQVLDPETDVGITVTLQNAQIAFEARNTSISEGTATADDSNGTLLTDTNADFVTDGVAEGDTIINFTDLSLATVVEVVSATQLKHYKLADGTNNDWNIGDTYKVFHVAQCNITGGNLVAVDDIGDPMSAISPTAFTQIILTKSSSATLADLEAIQYASFQNGVHIDMVHGQSGTTYPMGTAEYPVNNLADAKTIAEERGFDILHVCAGNLILGPTDNVDGYTLRGNYRIKTVVTVESGCSTEKTIFEFLGLDGALDGKTVLYRVGIGNITGFSGVANTCVLAGNITLAGSGNVNILHCYSGVPGPGTPEIDMGGSGRGLGVRAYNGGILIKNLTGDENISLDINSGQAIIDSTCEAGYIVVRGVSKLTDNSGPGCTVDSSNLVNPYTVADQIWDEATVEHILAGSFGKAAGAVFTDIELIRKIEKGKWEIVNNQMIFYDTDGVTPLLTFNLFNKTGQPAEEDVYKREPI